MNAEQQARYDDAMRLAVEAGYRGGQFASYRPGRYEGEPFYVAYYHDAALNGFADDSIGGPEYVEADLFIIDPDSPDRVAFGLAPDTYAVAVTYSDMGFIGVVEITEAEYARYLSEQEAGDNE